MSPDDAEGLTRLAEKEGIDFPLLLDPELEAVRRWGILNEENPVVPHPTVVIVDRASTVRFFHLDEDYRRRPPAETVVAALRGLIRPAD